MWPFSSFRPVALSGTASTSRRKPWGTGTSWASESSSTVEPAGTALITQRIWRTCTESSSPTISLRVMVRFSFLEMS